MGTITALIDDSDIGHTRQLISQLHPKLEAMESGDYVRYVRTLQAEAGYHLFAFREESEIACVAGFRICRNLGWGKFLYVDDFVTDGSWRSKGVGREMFEWLISRARSEGCAEVRLDARLDRERAHQFYLREGMEIVAHHFRLVL